MRSRITKLAAGVAALAALAIGGSALATAGNNPAPAQPAASVPAQQDGDSIQSGDQSTPDVAGAADAESSTESASSEVAGNDGPGGHADEPANANAGNQFEGTQ